MLLSNRYFASKVTSILIAIVIALFYFFPSYSRVPYSRPTLSETTISIPFLSPTDIPKKIWYKLGPRGLSEQSEQWINSCLTKNPSYKPEFMTDESGDLYVKEKYADRPDIVETFLALPFPILKADFLRYLLLYREGGVYSDLDVSCEDVPISDWIAAQYKKDTSVVVGWEFDAEGIVREFATWTIMAKPGSPHLLMVIEDLLEGVREKEREHNMTIAEQSITQIGDVVDFTGPRRMTRAIYKSLKNTLGDEFDEKIIANILEPKLVADVLVLPLYSLALPTNRYKPEEIPGPVLVKHHYASSWKNDNYGEVADPEPS